MATKEPYSLGVFTLVTYVPEPISRIIEGLRASIPGNGFVQPHITVVPPRPLEAPLSTVADFAVPVLRRFAAFEVSLGDVHCFSESNLLYLDISEGVDEIHDLHNALNRGVLAHPERFEFRPHVTIGGSAEIPDLETLRHTVRDAWLTQSSPCKFEVSEIAALWCDPAKTVPEWSRVWTHRLTPNGRTS